LWWLAAAVVDILAVVAVLVDLELAQHKQLHLALLTP
jgi:hypothetical protein